MWRFYSYVCFIVCIYTYISHVSCACEKTTNKKSQLREDLFCNHDPEERPVLNHKDATNVTFHMLLKNIEYDMFKSGLSVNFWLTISWADQFLTWKPADYDGIEEMIIDGTKLWKPDLSVYNRLEQSGSPTMMDVEHCILHNTGLISCVAPNNHEIMCTANVKYFPFDKQTCTMTVGSWIHKGEEVNVSVEKIPRAGISLSDFEDIGEWSLSFVNVTRTSGKYDEFPNTTFPFLNYIFVIARHSGVHVSLFIVPALTMSVMTMITFFMDVKEPDIQQRIYVLSANIIVHMIFAQFVGWSLPISGPQPPLILMFTRDSLILTTFSLILTTLQRKLIRCKQESPIWIATGIGYAMNNRAVQLIFMFDGSLKNVAERLGDDDGRNIIENAQTTSTANKDWMILAKFLDRLALIAYVIVYFCMLIGFIMAVTMS